jgi:hypothetical protein
MLNLDIKPSWFHGKDIDKFELGQMPYFSVSQIAYELGISVTSESELASDFLDYSPFVLPDREYRGGPEVFLPLPSAAGWVLWHQHLVTTEAGLEWLAVIKEQVGTLTRQATEDVLRHTAGH